jgi:uncharacterized protein (DUF2164 family)
VPDIKLDKPTREMLARQLKRHLKDEMDVEIDPFDAVALLDHLAETLGPHFYNQGLSDAQAIVKSRIDTVIEAIGEIEKPARY